MSTSSDSGERQTGADDTSSCESVTLTASQDSVPSKVVLTNLTERHRALLRQLSPTDVACSYKLAFDTQASGELLDLELPPAMDDDITGSTCMPSLHLPFLRSYRFPHNRPADLVTPRDLQRGWLVCNCRHRLNAVCIHTHRCQHGRAVDEIPEGVGKWVSRRRIKNGGSRILSSSHHHANSRTSSSGSSLPDKTVEIPFAFRHLEHPIAYIEQYRHDYTYRQMMVWQVDDASTTMVSRTPGTRSTKSLPMSISRQRSVPHPQLGRLRHIQECVKPQLEPSTHRHNSVQRLQPAHVPMVAKTRSLIRPPPINLSDSIQHLNVRSKIAAQPGSSAQNVTPPCVMSDSEETQDEKVTSVEPVSSQDHVTKSVHYVTLPHHVNGAAPPKHDFPSSPKPKHPTPWKRNSYLMRTPSAAFTTVLRMMRDQELGESPNSR